jgi:hypothetical protein
MHRKSEHSNWRRVEKMGEVERMRWGRRGGGEAMSHVNDRKHIK